MQNTPFPSASQAGGCTNTRGAGVSENRSCFALLPRILILWAWGEAQEFTFLSNQLPSGLMLQGPQLEHHYLDAIHILCGLTSQEIQNQIVLKTSSQHSWKNIHSGLEQIRASSSVFITLKIGTNPPILSLVWRLSRKQAASKHSAWFVQGKPGGCGCHTNLNCACPVHREVNRRADLSTQKQMAPL